VSATSARELVDDVHADTWAGDLPWDPSQCSLLEHFRQAIKQRTWLEIRISFVPLPDAANEEAMPDRPAFEEVEQALAVIVSDRCAPSRWLAMLEATCHELRARIDLVAALCLLPNIAYLVWRKRNRFPVCPACGHIDLVPSDSPLAAALRRGASEPLPPS
jgi:hypothetical protein